jgi:repressor LexA
LSQQPSSGSTPSEPCRRPACTPKQGQYLAFIYYYTKLNGVPPAERDMQVYFRTSPPAVHQMMVALERNGWIQRTPGQARSICLLLTRQEIPDLE